MPRKINENSLKNLKDGSAPDRPGETVSFGVRLPVDDVEWLRSLPGGHSYHVRRAVKQYRTSLDKEEAEPCPPLSDDFRPRLEALIETTLLQLRPGDRAAANKLFKKLSAQAAHKIT